MGHTLPKSGGELVTLFDSYSYNCVSADIWIKHTGPKSGGEPVTLFDTQSHDGVSSVIGVDLRFNLVICNDMLVRVLGFRRWTSQANRSKVLEIS